MNNFILINRCFSETTPESAEIGDFSSTGFISIGEKVTFTELVRLMLEHPEASDSSASISTLTWYSTGFYRSDYRTCTDREETIHFSDKNTINADKYWKWARIIANKKE